MIVRRVLGDTKRQHNCFADRFVHRQVGVRVRLLLLLPALTTPVRQPEQQVATAGSSIRKKEDGTGFSTSRGCFLLWELGLANHQLGGGVLQALSSHIKSILRINRVKASTRRDWPTALLA